RIVTAVPATRLLGKTARISRSTKPECSTWPIVATSHFSSSAIRSGEICAGIGFTMNMTARSIEDVMVGNRNAGTYLRRIFEVEPRAGDADSVGALRRDMSPRIDHH